MGKGLFADEVIMGIRIRNTKKNVGERTRLVQILKINLRLTLLIIKELRLIESFD